MFKIICEHTNKKSVFNISLASLGQFSLFCPFPAPCIPKPLTGRAGRESEMIMALWRAAQLQQCYQPFFFFLKGNHRTLQPMLKKINSISAKKQTSLGQVTASRSSICFEYIQMKKKNHKKQVMQTSFFSRRTNTQLSAVSRHLSHSSTAFWSGVSHRLGLVT